MAVKNGCILRLGGESAILALKSPETRVIDCHGGALIPGFNDAHCHFFSLMRKFFSLDLSPQKVHSIPDIRELLKKKAAFTPPGNWINGTDYNEFYLAEKRHPTRRDLDDVSPPHPVILHHRSMHACVLNSLGLKLVGITVETEEPPGGVIERDLESGEPNGLLFNMTGYLQDRISQPLSEAEIDWAAQQAAAQCLSLGITSIGEASVSNDLARWHAFRRLRESGVLKSRVDFLPGFEYMSQFRENGLAAGSGDSGLRLGGLKIVLSEDSGRVYPPQEDLDRMVLEAAGRGFPIAFHAVEQPAVESAVSALEQVRARGSDSYPTPPLRQRIEHCSECPPALRRRIARLGAVVVSQPPFLYYSGERYLSEVPPTVREYLYPFKSLIDQGVTVAGSSDSPVAFNDPLIGIYAAVTRRAASGDLVTPAEAVGVQQALDMYTANAAYAASAEKYKGSISPGKLADLVLLDRNPLLTPVEHLKDLRVLMTIIGGEIAWERPSSPFG